MSGLAERLATHIVPSRQALEDFLFSEAALLDEQRWGEWLALFAKDGKYWVPLSLGQPDPDEHVSLFYEDLVLMKMRVKRLLHPRSFSLEPPLRTCHILGNIRLKDMDDSGICVVQSAFHMLESRGDEQRITGGFYTHHLAYDAGAFKILLKRVDIINAEAAHEALQVFI